MPLVEEDWFQAADESALPIVAGRGQAMDRDSLASQIDGHSSIDEPLTPSDDPSEPTQMDPPGGFDPDQASPFTLAKARATQSHVEAVVSSVDDAPAGTFRHPVPQVADNEEKQQGTTVVKAFGEPRIAAETQREVSLSARLPRSDQTLEDFRLEEEIRVATIASLADAELAEIQSSMAQSDASVPHCEDSIAETQEDPDATQVMVVGTDPCPVAAVRPQPAPAKSRGRPASVRSQSTRQPKDPKARKRK